MQKDNGLLLLIIKLYLKNVGLSLGWRKQFELYTIDRYAMLPLAKCDHKDAMELVTGQG